MGKILKVALAILAVFVTLGIIGAALPLTPPQAPGPGGEDGTEQPALIDRPASELVIALSDMEAGWTLLSADNQTIEAVGFRDGYKRDIVKVESAYTHRVIYTTAWAFEGIEDADAYFDGLAQKVMANRSTESRTFGDEALYWEVTGDYIHMLIRKSNAVWKVSFFRQGAFLWDPSIDWVAGTLVLKA
jgi:hypothetical protein